MASDLMSNAFKSLALSVGQDVIGSVLSKGMGSLIGTSADELSKSWKPQREYMYEVYLPDVGGIDGLSVSQFVQEVSFGEYSMKDVMQMRYGAFRKGYAGLFEVETLKITFLRNVPDLVTPYLLAWKSKIINAQGQYYPKQNYSNKPVYIKLLGTDGSESGKFRLTGVFPIKFPSYKLAYTGTDTLKIPVEFNVDMVYVE